MTPLARGAFVPLLLLVAGCAADGGEEARLSSPRAVPGAAVPTPAEPAETMVNTPIETAASTLPPLDQRAPAHIRTATFALG